MAILWIGVFGVQFEAWHFGCLMLIILFTVGVISMMAVPKSTINRD